MRYLKPSDYKKHIKTRVDKKLGYVYFIDKEHPLSSIGGKVYYHRHVYSVKVNEWVDRKLQIHHVDGNKTNNDPSNLDALTMSEHQMTHAKNNGYVLKSKLNCVYCNKEFVSVGRALSCSRSCAASKRLHGKRLEDRITKEELEILIWSKPTTHVAIHLNCSDVAISKLCKRLGVDKPPRGYWAKIKSKG